MYYVLGKEREGGKKNGNYHVYEITMERKRAAEAVKALMEVDQSSEIDGGKNSNMAYKVIETDGDEFFFEDFKTFELYEKIKNLNDKGELCKDCVINFNDKKEDTNKSDIIDAVDNIGSVICDIKRINGILFFLTTDFLEFDLERKGARYIAQRAKEFLEMISDTLQNASDTLSETCQLIDK